MPECKCLPNAKSISNEIRYMSLSNIRRDFKEDADFIYGISFILNESGLVDVLDEANKLLEISKRENVDKHEFAGIAHEIADKIDKIGCR